MEKKRVLGLFLVCKANCFCHLWCDSGRRERDVTFSAWERMCCVWSGVSPILEFRTRHCLKATGSMLRLMDTERNPKGLPSTAVKGCSISCLSTTITHIHPPILVGSPALIPELCHQGCHHTGQAARATVGLEVKNSSDIWGFVPAGWGGGFPCFGVFFWVCTQSTRGMDWVHQQHSEVVSCRDSPVSARSKT